MPHCAAKAAACSSVLRPLAVPRDRVQYAPPLATSLEKTPIRRKEQHGTALLLPLEQHGVAEDALGLEGLRHVQRDAVVGQSLNGHAEVLGRAVSQY